MLGQATLTYHLIRAADGTVIGSRLLGQPFVSPGYFRSRPSAAGENGYDAAASSGSNLGPMNPQLLERVKAGAARLQSENPGKPVPVDLITTSASGLDPHITLKSALYQLDRVAGKWAKDTRRDEAEVRRAMESLLQQKAEAPLGGEIESAERRLGGEAILARPQP